MDLDRWTGAAVLAVALVVVLAGCSAVGNVLSEDASEPTRIAFENVTAESGLDYAGNGGATGNSNSGVYSADVDGDGWTDLLALGGDRPALFRNTGGGYENVTTEALPALVREFKSAAFVDVEGDGRPDLLLFPKDGDPVALHNEGGTFERTDYGLGNLTYPLGAASADYDGDGDADLFVYQSGDWRDGKPAGYFSLHRHVEDDNGNPNVLYENVGGEFERVDAPAISGERWSLAASFVDLTGDGRPDVHVANDYNNDTVYVNQGDGTFEQRLLGGATARNGMSSEIADVAGDERPDVFVTNIEIPFSRETVSEERYERLERFFEFVIHSNRTKGNTLLVNRGEGRFADRADPMGVRVGGWGWASALSDLDNDGDRDLLHTTQIVVRLDRDDPVYTYPMVWQREGETFDRVTAENHSMAEHDGRGMVTTDYDGDGDLDVVIATYDGRFAVYENTLDRGASAVQMRVLDDGGATALGAEVTVEGSGLNVTAVQSSNTDFLSQEPRFEHVGVGDAESVTVTVTWPDGTERTFEDLQADRRYLIRKNGANATMRLGDGS